MKTSSLIVLESSHTIVNETVILEEVTEAPHLIIGNPHISRTKGRRKDGEKVTQNCRFKSGLEVSLINILFITLSKLSSSKTHNLLLSDSASSHFHSPTVVNQKEEMHEVWRTWPQQKN
ncbi:hypothetical protein Lal_00006604, partial [Lupinus albus]